MTLLQLRFEARNEQRDITAANIRKARKVDKAQFLDDFKSGLIESKACKVCVLSYIDLLLL